MRARIPIDHHLTRNGVQPRVLNRVVPAVLNPERSPVPVVPAAGAGMEPQLITSINQPPASRLGTSMLGVAQESGTAAPAAVSELAQDLQTEDVDTAPLAGSLWVTQPSGHETSSTAPAAASHHALVEAVATPTADAARTNRYVQSSPSHTTAHQPVSQLSPQPSPQPSPKRSSISSTSQPTSPSIGPVDNLRTRMQRHTFVEDDDSDGEDDSASVRKALHKTALKKTGSFSVGKYNMAVDSDGDESDSALLAEPDDDLLHIHAAMNRNTISASAQQQAQEAAAAHAQDLWKPISIWSQTKPASTVKSEQESAVHLSHTDLQLLQTSLASPTHKRGLIQVRFPSEASPAASRMTQLPPERGRKWPLSSLFTIKAERKALTGLQLTADDAQHLQDIESCIAQGGQITDQLRDVRAKLHKLQQPPPTRAATQLKSSHTVAQAQLRSMVGDTPQKNPFLPPNYAHGRAVTSADDAQPYDCIRLLQSYDSKAGTAQRLQEHEHMMSDLYYALKAEAQYDLMTGETYLGKGSGVVQQLLQDSVQDLTEELHAEVAVMDGDVVHFKPAIDVAHGLNSSPSSKAPSSKASTAASRTHASSLRSGGGSGSKTGSSRVVNESSRDAVWLGVWGRLAALHESLPANAGFWQQLAVSFPDAFAAVAKLEDDAWAKMVQRSYLLAMSDFMDVLQLREAHCGGHYDECVPFIEKFIFLCNVFALECMACNAISDAYELLKLALNVNVPPGARFRNGRVLRVLTYISIASVYRRRKKLNAALKMMERAQQLEARMPADACRSFNWNVRPGPSPLSLLHTGCLLSQLSRKREAALAWSQALTIVDQLQRNVCTVEPTSRFLWKLIPPTLLKSFTCCLTPLCKGMDEIYVPDGARSMMASSAGMRSALSTAQTHRSQHSMSMSSLAPADACTRFLSQWNSLACVSAEVFAALYNLATAHEQAMRHDISGTLHIQSVCSAVKNWGLPYMDDVTDVKAIDASGAQVITLLEQQKDAPGWNKQLVRCLRVCLNTQIKRQGVSLVVQHLLEAGLPLQAATQLSIWVLREDPSHPPSSAHPSVLPRGGSAHSQLDPYASSSFDAFRPISAFSKTRASTATVTSRPRSSIGMSRALSPIANQPPAAAVSLLPLNSPTASIPSSTPTNIIVRSFRDIEHRAQMLQRAKTSSARLSISSQPLVVPNVPVRLRTQGAFSGTPSQPPRQGSPPPGSIGFAGLFSKKNRQYDSDGDDVVGEEEEEEERGAGSPEALPAFTLLQAAQRRERAHVE